MKKISEPDIDYLITQSENEIKINYKEKDILHIKTSDFTRHKNS